VRAQAALESFRLSSDGSFIVYAVRRVRANDYVSHLWLRPFAGGAPTRLTTGRVRDGSPAFAPDGRSVAFVRSPVGVKDAVSQAWILRLDRARPRRLTSLPHGVTDAAWSPDGTRLALLAPAGEEPFVVAGPTKRSSATARRITRLDYRDDASGHVGRRTHLWIVDATGRDHPRQLTSGDYDVAHPTWSPDGREIAFAADRGPDTTIAPRMTLWTVSVGARPRVTELASLAGDVDWPSYSPSGRRLAFVGTDVDDPPDDVQPAAWVRDLASNTTRSLTDGLDRPVGEWAWADLLQAEEVAAPAWIDDDSLVAIVGDRGRAMPYRLAVEGRPTPGVDPSLRIATAGVAAAARRIVVSAAIDGRAAEAYAVEDGALRRITREGSAWQRRFPQPELAELELPGPGGPIQAWLASPAGAGEERLPTILHLHGGPTGAWGPGGTLDAIALCGAGYRVLMPNIRGSATFGAAWVRALSTGWGTVDAEDALAAVDGVVERGLADARRLGVMGLSYGGYLTQWLIGVDDRFAAACSENGVANHISAWANSYFGVHYNRRAGLGDPLTEEGFASLWRASPLRNAAGIRTPLLMLQAEEDRICPASDSEQLFTALRVLERDVEYVLYPEEHHEMKSHGRPDRRIDRLERILDWFDRHLRP
jgi:dipeptidyl aminopeptidase/acylaminoacyl peptidase